MANTLTNPGAALHPRVPPLLRRQPPVTPTNTRVAAIDCYRGLVMLLMMAEVLRLETLAEAFPDVPIWGLLHWHQTHVDWAEGTLHDMIQPSFSFLVGVSLPFSLASRQAKGHGFWRMTLHAAWRALLLVALGVFLRSVGREQTNFTFEDTLSQIGLGYLPLFLLGWTRPAWQVLALVAILGGVFAAFALYPLPPDTFDYQAVGVPADWPHHYQGIAAHFNKNSNVAWAFDTWFLNLFPREQPFTYNAGGYSTLNFVPTLATMILGLLAGGVLQSGSAWWKKMFGFLAMAGICLGIGAALHFNNICPSVKRIWTPSWVLNSGAGCFLFLAGFYLLMDVFRLAFLGFPLRVIGANSIAAYVMAHLWEGFIVASIQTHLGKDVFSRFGEPYAPVVQGAAVLLVFWLILLWMYRQKFFVRI